MEYQILSNGVRMPSLGYGTLQVSNEEGIGKILRKSHVPRSKLFIATKVWVQDSGYNNTLKVFNTSLEKLGLDCIDHQPYGDKYGKSIAQVILRWLYQRDVVSLSKAVKKSRM